MFVEGNVSQSTTNSWRKFIARLASEATGLRNLGVYWDAEGVYVGLGCDLEFVLALAKIKGLEKMEINGFLCKGMARLFRKKSGRESAA